MCRMAYIPKDCNLSEHELFILFNHLEKRGGGVGSGIGWFDKKGVPHLKKGLDFTARELAARVRSLLDTRMTASGILYHTRLPTSGAASDFYCHPFKTGNWITCFNGTWMDFESYKLQLLISSKFTGKRFDDLIDANDAGTIAYLIEAAGFNIVKVIPNGVILSMSPTTVLVRGNFEGFECGKIGGRYLFASEFPPTMKFDEKLAVGNESIIQLFPEVKVVQGYFRQPTSITVASREPKGCSGNCLICLKIELCELYEEVDLC